MSRFITWTDKDDNFTVVWDSTKQIYTVFHRNPYGKEAKIRTTTERQDVLPYINKKYRTNKDKYTL